MATVAPARDASTVLRVNADTDSRVPRRVVVAVCCIEAGGALALAGIVIGAAAKGSAADTAGSAAEAAVAVLVASGLLALAVGIARDRRWPMGLIVTAQLLLAVVALSQIGAVLRAEAQRAVMLTILGAALVCGAAGLWGSLRLAGMRGQPPPAPGGSGRD